MGSYLRINNGDYWNIYYVFCLVICISHPEVLCLSPGSGLDPRSQTPALACKVEFTSPGLQFAFNRPGPQFLFTCSYSKFVFISPSTKCLLPTLASPEPGLSYTNLVTLICIYWPWPTICITVFWTLIYSLIVVVAVVVVILAIVVISLD